MSMKVPVDERHNTISNTRVLHEDAGQTLCTRPKSLLADSPGDCQCSPKSVSIVAFFLTLFYFKKDQNTLFCKRDFDLFSIFKKGWSALPQKETKQLLFCIT